MGDIMENTVAIPEGVQKTLLIPLWARARESQKAKPLLVDPRAASILDAVHYDYQRMDKSLGEYYQLTYTIRAKMLDEQIKSFLGRCPSATIVNIGAGLDTSFERVDNGKTKWYDLDLPEVIELRRRLIPETERSRCISKSVFDFSWFNDIGMPADGLLFMACGVFPYFSGKEMQFLFGKLVSRFAGSEIVFDTASRFFVWAGKWMVRWMTGISTPMKWGVDSVKDIVRWDKRIQIVDEYPLFSRIPMDASWSKDTVYSMRRADRMRGFNIVHLRFENQ